MAEPGDPTVTEPPPILSPLELELRAYRGDRDNAEAVLRVRSRVTDLQEQSGPGDRNKTDTTNNIIDDADIDEAAQIFPRPPRGEPLSWGQYIGRSITEVLTSPIRGSVRAGGELVDDAAHLTGFALGQLGGRDSQMYRQLSQWNWGSALEPETLPGQVTTAISQFLVGYVALGGLFRQVGRTAVRHGAPRIGQAFNWAGQSSFGPSLVRGAATDFLFFDHADANLSNLIQSVPGLANPVTEFLSTNPEDNEALNRFKRATEGVLLGAGIQKVLIEGILPPLTRAIQGYQRASADRVASQAAASRTHATAQTDLDNLRKMADEDQLRVLLGFEDKDVFIFRTAAEDKAALEAARGVAGAPGFRISGTTTDLKKTISPEHLGPDAPELTKGRLIQAGRYEAPEELTKYRVTARHPADNSRVSVRFEAEEDKLIYMANMPKNQYREQARKFLTKVGWTDDQIARANNAMIAEVTDRVGKLAGQKTLTVPMTAKRLFVEQGEEFLGVPTSVVANAMTRLPDYIKDGVVRFNFAGLMRPGGITSAVDQLVDAYQKNPEVRKWASVQINSQDINAVSMVMRTPVDRIMSDAQTLALAQTITAVTAKSMQLADLVRQPNATAATMYAFHQTLNALTMLLQRHRATGTEAARALNARKMRADLPDFDVNKRLIDYESIFGSVKSIDNLKFVASKLTQVQTGHELKAIVDAITDSIITKSFNSIRELWVNGILSGPKTLIINTLSPIATIAHQFTERVLASNVMRLTTDTGSTIQPGEVGAFMVGMFGAWKDAFRFANLAFWDNEIGRAWGGNTARTSVNDALNAARIQRISSDYWRTSPAGGYTTNALWNALDFVGLLINLPTKVMVASDEMWKTFIYRGEINALAFRQAQEEIASGKLAVQNLSQRMAHINSAEYLSGPGHHIMKAAKEQAETLTFTKNLGGATNMIANLRERAGPIGWFTMPFVNTPANILAYTFERMPTIALASNRWREAVAKGGEDGANKIAQLTVGTWLLAMGTEMYMNGIITGRGPRNNAERQALFRQGWQPYSIQIGNTYHSFNRLDPFGLFLGIVADIGETATRVTDDDRQKDWLEITGAAALGMMNSFVNKTYFSGLAGLLNAVHDSDRYGDSWIHRFASSFIPYSGAVYTARRIADPYMREVAETVDAFASRLPGLSSELPPSRDLWGRIRDHGRGISTLYNALSPIEASIVEPQPVDTEMMRNNRFFSMPDKTVMVNGRPVNLNERRDIYERYVHLSGNEWQSPALGGGALDVMNQIIGGTHLLSEQYNGLSNGRHGDRMRFISQLMRHYRQGALAQLINEFPELQNVSRVEGDRTPLILGREQ